MNRSLNIGGAIQAIVEKCRSQRCWRLRRWRGLWQRPGLVFVIAFSMVFTLSIAASPSPSRLSLLTSPPIPPAPLNSLSPLPAALSGWSDPSTGVPIDEVNP
jgi:hypothetical protein